MTVDELVTTLQSHIACLRLLNEADAACPFVRSVVDARADVEKSISEIRAELAKRGGK